MKQFSYVLNLVKFAFNANPLMYLSVAITLISVFIELLAMSSLLPLFTLVSGDKPVHESFIPNALILLGLQVNAAVLLWTVIILLTARIVTQLIGQSLTLHLGKRVLAQLGSRAFDQIIHTIPISKINKKSVGFYINLAGDEAFRASNLVISLSQFVSTSVLSLLYFVAIAQFSPAVAGVLVLFMLLFSIVLAKLIGLSHRLGGRQTVESRNSHSIFLDSLNNIKTVRALSAERYVVDMYRSIMYKYTRTLFLVDEIAILTKLVPVILLLVISGMWLALSMHPIDTIGLAFIVTMIVYLMRFFPTIGQGVMILMRIASDANSGKDVTSILGENQTNLLISRLKLERIEKIQLIDIQFSYDENINKDILKGINLVLRHGKSYALVGNSGVGKSTLVDLLLKFYPPNSGSIYINNQSISDINESDIRNKMILVNQDAAIFNDTVANNICIGKEATLEEVKAACVAACINEVIEDMPERYNTRLQYLGKNLSGGQRQRISIARALLRKPDVLILDESTNALDKETQEKVIENILREYSEKIVIFVTHDPKITRKVDEVIDFSEINSGYR